MIEVPLLSSIRTSRAIATLLSEQSLSTAEGKQALQNLKKIGTPAIPKLIEALSNQQNSGVIENLLSALLNQQSLSNYLQALASPDQEIVRAVTRILCKSEAYDPNQLLELFLNPDISKTAVGEIISSHADKINFSELIALVDKVTSTARPIIYRIIDQHVTIDAIPSLVLKVKSNEPMVRAFVASALSRFNTKDTRNALVQLLSDPNKNVREAALKALGKLKAFDTVEMICQMLTDHFH